MQSLLVNLRGPLRSWGGLSAGDNRETLPYPTASAVLGIAAACMGIDHGDRERNAKWYQGFSVCTASCVRLTEQESFMGDNATPALETDFQTAQNTLSMDDSIRTDILVSNRQYIADGLDVAAIIPRHKDAEIWLQNLVFAFEQPAFTPYLGRRANPFSAPILERGDGVTKYASFYNLVEKLYKRLVRQKIGPLYPSQCLLRIPSELHEKDFDEEKKWIKGGMEFVPDQRVGALRIYEHRMVYEYFRNFDNEDVL